MSEETGTPGRTEMQAYKADPVNVESPTANHKAIEKQYNAELLITQKEILEALADTPGIRVSDYSPVGDGVADDTVPVQNAMNAAFEAQIPLFIDGIYAVTNVNLASYKGQTNKVCAIHGYSNADNYQKRR